MSKLFALTPETPSPTQQMQAGKRRFSKKLYLVVAGALAIAVILGAFLIQPGAAAIPLNVDYTVGEKMVYGTTIDITMQIQNSSFLADLLGQLGNNTATMNGESTIEVLSFDGQYYTLNQTVTTQIGGRPFSYSVLQRMNKTGYSTYMFDFGNAELSVSDPSAAYQGYLAQLLSKPEVKVGDSITVPFPLANSSVPVTGTLTLTFGGIQDLTVPAGTFKVFKVELTSNNLQFSLPQTTMDFGLSGMQANLSYQMYMEYGTMRQIKSTMQETMTIQSSALSAVMNITMDMTLNQDIKP